MNRNRPKSSRKLRRGAYLLPSLFTVGTIVLGFYAVIRGLRGDFASAALMIILAGVLDNLDGRIARLTNTDSDFGREFDSLADVLTFGAAPALLAHLWGFRELGRVGWLLPLFFLVCATTRLARFNVQTKDHGPPILRWAAGAGGCGRGGRDSPSLCPTPSGNPGFPYSCSPPSPGSAY